MSIDRTQTVLFPNDNTAKLVHPQANATAAEMIAALALPAPRALVLLNGGTADLDADLQERLAVALADGLARVVAEEGVTVITGGTDAGVFRLFGQGLARWGATAPCIGVAVAELTAYPGHPQGEASLEPHHSHFVLTAGHEWGAETPTMYALAATLARKCPSLAVFAGGGAITLREMAANVAQGRTILLLADSGRNTDAVLAAAGGEPTANPEMSVVARYPGIVAASVEDTPAQLRETVRRLLFKREQPPG